MNKEEAEQEEEFTEWVVIQNSPTSSPIDASTPQTSPRLQSSHHHAKPRDSNDEVASIAREEGEDEPSSPVTLSLPCRVIETAKKRFKNSGFFPSARSNPKRVFWSFTFVGGLFLASSLVYVKLVRWWKTLHEEKMSFLLVLLREKDQKIKELMHDIGRLNELLSSRRRVRVIRIV